VVLFARDRSTFEPLAVKEISLETDNGKLLFRNEVLLCPFQSPCLQFPALHLKFTAIARDSSLIFLNFFVLGGPVDVHSK